MIPTEVELPSALSATVRSDLGSLPTPRLWNGPESESEIGPFSVRDPEGVTVRATSRLPLLTVCWPQKVCFRRLTASPELPPHPARATAQAAVTTSPETVRSIRPRFSMWPESSNAAPWLAPFAPLAIDSCAMPARTILYTGKGGVGKTSVAACTARACAAAGARTLLISTDPAHSLAESLQAELDTEPRSVSSNLWAQ